MFIYLSTGNQKDNSYFISEFNDTEKIGMNLKTILFPENQERGQEPGNKQTLEVFL